MGSKVSVIMITYNHEKFIEQAVNSVLEQKTNFNYELIIANDNSPDSTHEVITKLIDSHPKAGLINYFKNEINLGANANYIKAYMSGKGKYIAVCEGDDYWGDKSKLQRQVDFLEQHPEYVLTYHDVIYINEKGSRLNKIYNTGTQTEITQSDLMKGIQPLYLTTCYRKLPIEIPEVMGSLINGDTFLTSILGNYGKGKWLDIKPAFYRFHPGGVWSQREKEYKFKGKIQLFKALKYYYESHGNLDLKDYFANQVYLYNKMLIGLYMQKKNIKFIKYAFRNYYYYFNINKKIG